MAIIDPTLLGVAIVEMIGSFIFISAVLIAPNPFVAACGLVAAAYIASRLSGSCFNPLLVFTDYMNGSLPATNNSPTWAVVAAMLAAQIIGAFLAVQCRKYIASVDALTPTYSPLAY